MARMVVVDAVFVDPVVKVVFLLQAPRGGGGV
jgi:hypothetical protein